LGGVDRGDGRPLDGHFSGKFGLEDERFVIRLEDGSGKSVAVAQSHLVGENRLSKNHKGGERNVGSNFEHGFFS
jgi:hypothetical protein